MRKFLFYLHLVLGLASGLVIALLAATGIIMSLEVGMIERSERALVAEYATSTAPVSVATIYRKAQEQFPQMAQASLTVSSDDSLPIVYQEMRGARHYFHPRTGEYLGLGDQDLVSFFRTVTSLHRWLVWQTPQGGGEGHQSTWREWGGKITAAACLVYFLLTITGLVLWCYRTQSWKAVKAKLFWNRKLKHRARDWNLHHVLGMWATPFIMGITLTGLIMAYPWANELLFAAFGEKAPLREEHKAKGPRPSGRGKTVVSPSSWQDEDLTEVIVLVSQQLPTWQMMSLQVPAQGTGQQWSVQAHDAGRGRPDRMFRWLIDPHAGTVQHAAGNGPRSAVLTPAGKARQWVRWIHTGEAGGWWGQCLAVLACVATLLLVWTGFALSWRRFFRKKSANN
jgi:uncharacterized iron-regulated membrane protein